MQEDDLEIALHLGVVGPSELAGIQIKNGLPVKVTNPQLLPDKSPSARLGYVGKIARLQVVPGFYYRVGEATINRCSLQTYTFRNEWA